MRGKSALGVLVALAVVPLARADAWYLYEGSNVARAPIRLAGTATLAPVDVSRHCRFTTGRVALVASCRATGAYAGRPGRAGAGYGWVWTLELGPTDITTGFGTERGELALNFGRLGVLRVTTQGRQVPVGTPTANAATGRTTGTWRFKSGSASFRGRRGTGTFAFVTERRGPTTFQVARITIAGTLR